MCDICSPRCFPVLQPYDLAREVSEGLYAELPPDSKAVIKSQYQHVDALPSLPEKVRQVTDVLVLSGRLCSPAVVLS